VKNFREYKVFKNPNLLATFVGEFWRNLQSTTRDEFFVSCPLSSTPLPLYNWIAENASSFTNWDKVKFLLMDEQLEGSTQFEYVSSEDTASYEKFARDKFLNRLPVSIPILKPDLERLENFDQMITSHGGLDLLVLAIGVKGHYAQVMPGTSIETGFHVTKLISELAQVHTQKGSSSYEGAHFREYGMSLGPKQVLEAKNIIVMITGESKRELTQELLSYDSFDQNFPLSIIHNPSVQAKTHLLISREVMT
jgi:glucosamine-6-phosphate deaminase